MKNYRMLNRNKIFIDDMKVEVNKPDFKYTKMPELLALAEEQYDLLSSMFNICNMNTVEVSSYVKGLLYNETKSPKELPYITNKKYLKLVMELVIDLYTKSDVDFLYNYNFCITSRNNINKFKHIIEIIKTDMPNSRIVKENDFNIIISVLESAFREGYLYKINNVKYEISPRGYYKYKRSVKNYLKWKLLNVIESLKNYLDRA